MIKILLLMLVSFLMASCSLTGSKENAGKTASSGACSGHPDNYRIGGKKYRVLSTAQGYQADGMAVLYADKAQGSKTTGCEDFDMNGFTAAHRTLPLPTHIKITNKNNNKSVVVKVNDRGPAKAGALIQVTPAIANVLEANAAFPVHIEAITRTSLLVPSAGIKKPVTKNTTTTARKPDVKASTDRYYIVVGTYPAKEDAFERFIRVSSIGLANVAMESRQLKGRTLHMVRIGPFFDQDKIDNAKDRLRSDGLTTFSVVKN